jgi:hypothetical protein
VGLGMMDMGGEGLYGGGMFKEWGGCVAGL